MLRTFIEHQYGLTAIGRKSINRWPSSGATNPCMGETQVNEDLENHRFSLAFSQPPSKGFWGGSIRLIGFFELARTNIVQLVFMPDLS